MLNRSTTSAWPRWIVRGTLAAVLGLAALGGVVTPPAEERIVAGPVSHKPGHERKTFTVSGSVQTLYPGETRDLVVTITNPQSFAIAVTRIDVQAQADPTHPGCSASTDVDTTDFEGWIVVPKNGSTVRSGILSVSMEPTAPNACQGAKLPLKFGGQAVKP